MKFIAILLFLTTWIESVLGQDTFNLRERYNFEACTLTSIVPTDSCYFVTGIIADTIFPYRTGSIFLKLNLDGEPLLVKTVKSTEKTYETWYNGLILLEDKTFITVGHTIDSTLKTILIKYNDVGDTIFTKEFFNPFYPNSIFIKPWAGIFKLPDGGFVISTNITNLSMDTDFYLIRTDSLGNKVWGKIYSSGMWERSESISVTSDGKIVAGGIRTNQNTNVQNYIFQCHLFRVDTSGNLDWAWTSSTSIGLRDAANDMLLLDDGSIIVASGIGHEQVRASVNEVYFDRHVFKLNPLHEIEWELTFQDPEKTAASRTTNLVKLSDGTGYILAGMVRTPPAQPSGYGVIEGWLAKISVLGDSLWTRRYHFPINPPSQHTVYDMKETPDGGLILCGQSLDLSENATYPQQAWLLKLDQFGCLVPGCHLIDATGETKPEIKLAIYPNPTTDYLNFYLRTTSPVWQASFRIIDAAGAVVREFQNDTPGATYILPVWDWAAGTYWLQVIDDHKVLTTEKFIKLNK